jgi:AcrR family transcriptional regulator
MPRRSAQQVRATRDAVLRHSVEIASVHGLDGLSFGQIAGDVGLSKSGLAGYFASKTQWQLAVVEHARARFGEAVLQPGREAADPEDSPLVRTCRAWLTYLEEPEFPGGCFFVAAASEFDGREGPVRDAIRAMFTDLRARLAELVAEHAALSGRAMDPEQAAFELLATMVCLNHCLRLGTDPDAGARARRSLSALLDHRV